MFLSLVLRPNIARWANIALPILYVVSIVASVIGEDWAYFFFFSIVESVLLLLIIRYAGTPGPGPGTRRSTDPDLDNSSAANGRSLDRRDDDGAPWSACSPSWIGSASPRASSGDRRNLRVSPLPRVVT